MKLLFDLECTQPSVSSKRHGGGIYGEIVLRKLIENKADVVAYYNSSKWLNPEIEKLCNDAPNISLVDRKGLTIQQVFDKNECGRLFSALPGIEYSAFNGDKVCVLHGLRLLELIHDNYSMKYPIVNFRDRLRFLAERYMPGVMKRRHKREYSAIIKSGDFIVVSNHTASAVKLWFPETKDKKIEVFYSPSTVSNEPVNDYPAVRPYMLMVSGNRWEKNAIRAIEAIEKLYDNNLIDDIDVIVTGVKDFKSLKHKMKYPERFKAMEYVDDNVLRSLYKSAYAFIYPSLNEGFGYPPLEAMHYGVPVVASAICSIPEVCGDSVLYFNPLSVDEIANRIMQVMNPEMHARLSEAARKRGIFIRDKQEKDLQRFTQYLTR